MLRHITTSVFIFLLLVVTAYAAPGNLEKVFKDDFPGTVLNTGKWLTPTVTGAAGYSVASSNLVATLTTGATDSVIFTSREAIYIPNRISFSLLLSARSANQEVIVQAISEEYKATAGVSGHMAQWKFNGTTATTGNTRTQNSGTAGTDTARTIATTATTSIFSINMGIDDVRFGQTTVDNAGAKNAIFLHNAKLPDPAQAYYLQIIVRNTGASTALTATIDFISCQTLQEVMAEVSGGTGDSTGALAVPVNIIANGASATPQSVAGPAAHDATISGNPVRIAGRAMTSNYTAVANGEVADQVMTLVGVQIVKPFSIPELDWSYAAAAGGIVNTTDVPIKAAAGAGIRNYLTGLDVRNANAVATEFVIKDGSTVIWREHLPANMTFAISVAFPSPLKSTANAALNAACLTTAAQVYVNAQGYQAP